MGRQSSYAGALPTSTRSMIATLQEGTVRPSNDALAPELAMQYKSIGTIEQPSVPGGALQLDSGCPNQVPTTQSQPIPGVSTLLNCS